MRPFRDNRLRLLGAAVALALLTGPAFSQAGLDQKAAPDPAAAERKRADERAAEKAYRDATRNIPAKSEVADPWATVRGADKPQSTQSKSKSGTK